MVAISAIIPVFNEAQNIRRSHEKILQALRSTGVAYEVIYVDDGSVDDSSAVLGEIKAADRSVRVIRLDKNWGQTSALDAGFRAARGEYILTTDADLPYDPHDWLRVLEGLKDHDAVIGYRRWHNRVAVDGYVKALSSVVANGFRNVVLRERLRDVGCSLRGFKRTALEGLMLYRGFQVFIMSMLNKKGCTIKQIEVESFPRLCGTSNYTIGNRLFKELYALFVVKYLGHYALRYVAHEE